ncbi:MAG: toxin HicA [Chloroflexi bacterium]|nr:toxin HicA [Chloroflexota bacterium]
MVSSRYDRLIRRILSGSFCRNLRFDELRQLLLHLGFEERTRGSHYIFVKVGVEERHHHQRDDGQAKPYQVRQVRSVILKYQIRGNS